MAHPAELAVCRAGLAVFGPAGVSAWRVSELVSGLPAVRWAGDSGGHGELILGHSTLHDLRPRAADEGRSAGLIHRPPPPPHTHTHSHAESAQMTSS